MSRLNKILVLLALCASFSFAGPVYVYGALKACKDGTKGRICGSKSGYTGPVQLRGVSLGWSNTTSESSRFFNEKTIDAMVDGWKAEVIRVPLGIGGSPAGNGYDTESQATANWNRVKTAVDAAIAKDVYVIIDWHAHAIETTKASNFFANVAAAYHNDPHVIFEIFNEPRNQDGGTWANIRTYANSVVSAIRAKGAENLILVGTPNWSQDVDEVTAVTDSKNNIGYVLHFYAQQHSLGSFQTKVNTALNNGFPIFVTEYGTTDASGGNPTEGNYDSHSPGNADAWHTYMNSNKISSCAWQVSDREEGAAFFGLKNKEYGWFSQNAGDFINENNMTASGKYIFGKLKGYANNTDEPWRSVAQPSSSSGGSGSTLIDNFEDGDSLARTFERWFVYTDSDENDKDGKRGASTITNTKTSNDDYRYIAVFQDGTNWVAGIKSYTLSKGTLTYDPFVAIGLDAKNNPTAYDLSRCTGGFSYKYKGVAHKFKILQSNVTDYNYHNYITPASTSTWTTATIPLSYLDQEGWGPSSPVIARDITKVKGFAWEVNKGVTVSNIETPTTGSLLIDDFTCIGSMPLPAGGTSSPSGGSSSSRAGSSSSVSGSSSSGAPGSSSSGGISSSGNGSSSSGAPGSSSSGSNTTTSSSSGGANPNPGSSSSVGNVSPIAISKIANANSMSLINNGVSLQVKNNAALEVFNTKGISVSKMNFSSGVYSVQLQSLPKGLYIARVQFGSNREVMYVPIR